MRVTITFDYPDELVEEHGHLDAAATLAARLEEVYPGNDGAVLVMGTGQVTADPVVSDVRELAGPVLRIRVGDRAWLASPGALVEEERDDQGDLLGGDPVVDGDVTYYPWSDGRVVGYRCVRVGAPDEYVYLNPSDRDEDEKPLPDVFLYWGTGGDPSADNPVTYIPVLAGTFGGDE